MRAALEFAARRGRGPRSCTRTTGRRASRRSICKTLYAAHPVLGGTPSVFTIHNLAYQGLFEPDWLPRLDLPWELLAHRRSSSSGARISFLKGGINDADAHHDGQPAYAQEIQTPEFGFGFDGILRRRARRSGRHPERHRHRRSGIPRRDPHPAGAVQRATTSSGKGRRKRGPAARYGLPVDDGALERPLVGMISRMVDQKGFDLIAALADELPRLGRVVRRARHRRAALPGLLARAGGRASAIASASRIGFDEGLAHLIEAGADMFLMPSRFEPCGLNQMYSLRYGTVPVVRRVGGLADTVRGLRAGPSGRRPGSCSTTTRRRRCWRAAAGAGASSRTRRRGGRSRRPGCGRTIPGTVPRAEYVKIYERARALMRATSGQ